MIKIMSFWETDVKAEFDRLTCNNCRKKALCDRFGYQQASNFCPHCGAVMFDGDGDVLVDPYKHCQLIRK